MKYALTDEEIEELRAKKQAIHEELKDKIPGTIKNMDHEQLEEYAWWLYRRVGVLERERKFSKISRVEVIGPESREYVRYFNEEEYMDWDLQDDDRTLKIFINNGNDDIMKMPPEQDITPDSWVIIEVNHEGEQFQKILSGWSGGYLDGDAWRMSSRIKEINIKVNQDYFTVDTESGSKYNLFKSRQGMRMSNAGIYNQLKEKYGHMMEIITL